MQKRGIAVPTALVLITVLLGFFVAMMNFSSHEMHNVKLFYEQKRAEYLAYSGLNWAEVKLQGKRWWVSGGFDPTKKISRATGGAAVHEFFGSGNGKTYIIAEEFESANPSPVKGYSKVQRLDHIRVISIGEYKDQRVLVYGKYIMSPEPFLNSDSTEGAETQTTATTEEGKVAITVPEPWSQDGPVPELMIVESINVGVGSKVNPNVILATLAAHPSDPVQITMTWDIKAPAFGTLTKVNFAVGQPIRARDLFGECTDELMVATRSNKTLKKMVRVTKVIDRSITDLDLTDFAVRRNKLDAFIKKLSDEYVVNYAKNLPHIDQLESSFGSPPLGNTVKQEEVLRRLSAVPGNSSIPVFTAGNKFMEDMLEKWTMPGLTAPQREKFPGMSEYHLAIGKSQPRAEIMEVLAHFGRLGDIVTRPQKNPELYKLTSTERYKSTMGISDFSKPSDQFVHDATFLQDAAKKITITFNKGTPWEDAVYKEKVANGEINAGDYWYWPSKAGWYTKPDITIEAVEIPYNFVNKASGQTFTMEVGFVLNYLRKHYDEGMAVPPGGPIRFPSDQQDTPQAPGPPDSTGAKYSGISS
ncbi:MAG: hypothetical protein GQF41_0813 [Candidatus Rifleibacterium amylolyticum]|nr:MAG: hypothetical protein GQF41_0813 [Candidatus Rifleibacterium amylolyticum]NLF97909.1 hypothetical protein [Candidatus Riflebacteria bacterium]